MDLASCTALNRTSDVAPKKMTECAFSLEIKEHKEVRTYFLSAHSEGEKKQWLDAMVASKKYFSSLVTMQATQSKPLPAAGAKNTDQELASARAEVKRLKEENSKLKQELDQRGDDNEHEELVLRLEELEEKYAFEKKKREALEKAAKSGGSVTPRRATANDEDLDAIREEYEEKVRFLEAQHAKQLQAAKKSKVSDEDDGFDAPDFGDDDSGGFRASGARNSKPSVVEAQLKKENAALKKQLEEKDKALLSKSPRGQKDDPRIRELEEEIVELNEVIERLTHEVAELQLDKQEWEGAQEMSTENETLKAQIEELEKALDELEAEQKLKQKSITELQAKVRRDGSTAAREEELLKKIDVLDGVLLELEQELDAAKQDVEKYKRENQQLRAKAGGNLDAAALEEENAHLAEELEIARSETAKYKQKLDLLRVEYKKLFTQQQQKK